MSCISEMFRPCEYVLLLVMVFLWKQDHPKGTFYQSNGCNGVSKL